MAEVTVRCTTAGSIQVGASPEEITTYGGDEGSTQEVPADVAALLIDAGIAEPVKAAPKRAKRS